MAPSILQSYLAWMLPLLSLFAQSQIVNGRKVNVLAGSVSHKRDIDHNSGSVAKLVVHDASFIPDTVLRVTQQTVSQSCLTKEDVAVVNGSIPGPEIRFKEGRVYWIRVYNDLPDKNLTMHWHGLSEAVSPFSDGTPAASQWPIPPNHFFDYELETAVGMAGTYFYHSHVGFQAVSVSGPLIVEDANPVPYQYDEDRIVFLSDIFNKTDSQIETGLQGSPFVWSGEPLNVLVNGKGQRLGNATSPTCQLANIEVEPDKTYRFRFIGGTALSFLSLGIEDHPDLTIIEADGAYTKPVNTSYLQIGSGQRFSVLLHTKPQSYQNTTQFYMQIETRERPLVRSYAVLSYKSSKTTYSPPPQAPLTLPNTTLGWLDHQLLSLTPASDFPSAGEVTRRVTVRVHQLVNSHSTWAQNGVPWTEAFPAEPYLVSLYKDDGVEFPSLARALANDGVDPVTRAFPADVGEVLEIVIQNTGSDTGAVDVHPFHAHGAHYYDLGSGNGTYDADANEAALQAATGTLAPRDTTMLYRYETQTSPGADAGWRAWRLRITQPGVWMVHCHILQHMIMGMQTVWVMGNETEIMTVPEDVVAGYLTYGGDVYGNETYAPSVMHYKSG